MLKQWLDVRHARWPSTRRRPFLQTLRVSYEQQTLPDVAELAPSTVMTSLAVLCAPAVLAVLANRKGRKLMLDAIETILASILVVLLLCIVLGLPIGKALLHCMALLPCRALIPAHA